MKIAQFALALISAFSTSVFAETVRICQELLEQPHSIEIMLGEYAAKGNPVLQAQRLRFNAINGHDVYNQTTTFPALLDGKPEQIKLGRVEPRANHDSQVWVFKRVGDGVYEPVKTIAPFIGEDPFFQFINGELFVGFVETFKRENSQDLGYRTVFYRDHRLGVDHLTRFATGPEGMKDIRFAQIPRGSDKGKVRVVARPQHSDPLKGGRGKNAFGVIDSIDLLNASTISQTELMHGQVPDHQWIGTNHVFPLKNGDVVYLSHVAHFENEATKQRGYYVSIYSDRFPRPRIILTRYDIEQSFAPVLDRQGYKRPDLLNVLFAGGLRRTFDGKAILDVGAGDAEAWEVTIPDPIRWYESASQKQ